MWGIIARCLKKEYESWEKVEQIGKGPRLLGGLSNFLW